MTPFQEWKRKLDYQKNNLTNEVTQLITKSAHRLEENENIWQYQIFLKQTHDNLSLLCLAESNICVMILPSMIEGIIEI